MGESHLCSRFVTGRQSSWFNYDIRIRIDPLATFAFAFGHMESATVCLHPLPTFVARISCILNLSLKQCIHMCVRVRASVLAL